MKRIILILIIFLFFFKDCKNKDYNLNVLSLYFNNEEVNYIIENNIKFSEIENFLEYETFNIYKYFDYKEIIKTKNISIIEALNTINYPNYYLPYKNPKKAKFTNTNLILVNKSFFLDNNYKPNNLKRIDSYNISFIKRDNETMLLNEEALLNYYNLYNDALKVGYNLCIFSAYRDYNKQYNLYYHVNNANDYTVARPGFSEHQSGYAIDVSTTTYGLTNHFENSPEYSWLINNCHKYGYILRYPKDKTKYTNYNYESWHFRFVGVEIATFLFNKNLTLEEYIYKYIEIK